MDASTPAESERVTGLEEGLGPHGRLQLFVGDAQVSYLEYYWDPDGQVLDLGNAGTHPAHQGRGYATRLLADLVHAAPRDAVLRAVGDHSDQGRRWMAGALRRGYRIHQSGACFRGEGRGCAGPMHPDPCPVQSDERLTWIKPLTS